MFFPLLSFDEKKKCLSLLVHIAKCDNEFHPMEEKLIAGYSLLMGIEPIVDAAESIDGLIDYFSEKQDMTKRAVFLESLGLAVADNILHAAEKSVLEKMLSKFCLEDSFMAEAKNWVSQMLPLYYKGFEMVGVKA